MDATYPVAVEDGVRSLATLISNVQNPTLQVFGFFADEGRPPRMSGSTTLKADNWRIDRAPARPGIGVRINRRFLRYKAEIKSDDIIVVSLDAQRVSQQPSWMAVSPSRAVQVHS
ncbi:MAG: hypothetical protein L6Q83_02035 [Gammaproteobacteria bacterium]|nr:hypothetical protein [Gammaproteobacteria bacterium]